MFQFNYFCVSHLAGSLGSLLLSDWHTACGGGNWHADVSLERLARARRAPEGATLARPPRTLTRLRAQSAFQPRRGAHTPWAGFPCG